MSILFDIQSMWARLHVFTYICIRMNMIIFLLNDGLYSSTNILFNPLCLAFIKLIMFL